MASLPPLKRLYESDIAGKSANLLVFLNNVFQNLWNTLNRNLTFQDNIRSQIVDLSYVGGSAINISSNLKAPLIGIIPIAVGGEALTGGLSIRWQQTGQVIEIKQITGLTAGAQYQLRLLLI